MAPHTGENSSENVSKPDAEDDEEEKVGSAAGGDDSAIIEGVRCIEQVNLASQWLV